LARSCPISKRRWEHGRDLESQWSLLAGKARRWLDNAGAEPPAGGAWTEAASRFIAETAGKR